MIKQERQLRPETQPGASSPEWARTLETFGRRVWPVRTEVERQRWRQTGYIATVVINALLMVIAHNLLNWRLPFITSEWAAVLWAIDLSLSASIVANALYLAYDRPWFHDLAEIVLTGLALVAGLTLLSVFPFDFGDPSVNGLARLIGALVCFALAIALLVQMIVWVVERIRQALR